MEVNSEKTFYEINVTEAFRTVDADVILWGEDLYDAKIVLYPKKITALPGYGEIKERLVNAGLVYFNFRTENFIKFTVVRWDEVTRRIYIAEGNFNAIWKYLRNSVRLGIKIKQKNGESVSIEKAEDIIDLSNLQRKGSGAVIKDGQLVYEAREVSESERLALGRKQSALDNQKNRYFYSKFGDRYHDKDCEMIREIPPEDFLASTVVPEGYKPCRKCCRRVYLRKACAPYVKQIRIVDHILRKQGITDYQLGKYAFEYGLKFRVDEAGDLVVKGKEDTWIIKAFDSGKLTLWHNNYVKTTPEERYITSGFHNQGMEGKKLNALLEYINDYTFEKHLAAEERAEQEKAALEYVAEETNQRISAIEQTKSFEAGGGQEERKELFGRLKNFVKRLFLKFV